MSSADRRRFVIEAFALNGRWSVTSAERRDRVQWPPAPDTLFSALVASAAGLGRPDDEALRWLERRDPPAIECERGAGRTEAMVTYAPVADLTMFDPKSRQIRRHASIGSDQPVRWSWVLDPEEEGRVPLASLAEISAGVSYIGSSRGPVLARAFMTEVQLPKHALVPAAGGDTRLRVPLLGRLEALDEDYRAGRRPRPAPAIQYAPLGETALGANGQRTAAAGTDVAWSDPFILARQSGPAMGLDATVPVMEAARRALLSHLGDEAPPILTGHGVRGSDAPHLALMPLARVGDPYAAGELMGIALVLPGRGSSPAVEVLARGVGSWLGSGGHLSLGAFDWTLGAPGETARRPRALRPERYTGSSRVWSTLTPVALGRHPKFHPDGRPKAGRSIPEIVAIACRQVGLPEPEEVEASAQPFLKGTSPARAHALGRRNYLKNAPLYHLRLRWHHPVSGPVLLGSGRYFGLGTLIPSQAEAERGRSPEREAS